MRQCNQILHFSELPLLVWAFIRVPTLFIIFPAFFSSFCFWFHNILWPALCFFEPVHCFSGDTKKQLLSGREFFSWGFLTDNKLSPTSAGRGEVLCIWDQEEVQNAGALQRSTVSLSGGTTYTLQVLIGHSWPRGISLLCWTGNPLITYLGP